MRSVSGWTIRRLQPDAIRSACRPPNAGLPHACLTSYLSRLRGRSTRSQSAAGGGNSLQACPGVTPPPRPPPQAGEGDEQRGVWSAKAVTHRVVAVDYAFANPPYEVFPEHPLVVIHRARRRSYASRRCPGDPRSWRTRGRTWMAGTSARVASPGHDGERMPRHAGAAYLCLFSALPPGR